MTNRQNNFYAFSLFCLVPVFGILLAVVFIFFAIFDLKNKTFLIILLFLIPVNVAFTLFAQHRFENFMQSDEFQVSLTKGLLFEVKRNLSEYRKNYGQYPDSLSQLKKANPYLEIRDIGMHPVTKISYYYKKNKDNYVLFSTGEDAIPFTGDDIFSDTLTRDVYLKAK
ncbi:MAG TPA: hypothetical protein VKR53_05685 [Puia sp.]|nr:hypothetical protein [Puia sp.]